MSCQFGFGADDTIYGEGIDLIGPHSWIGEISGDAVKFKKQYRGKNTHYVEYDGIITPSLDKIEG